MALVWGLLVAGIWGFLLWAEENLVSLSTASGWLLLASFLLLGLYGLRKKVPFLPLGTVAAWLRIHIGTGLTAVALFFVHSGWAWPTGWFESILWICFLLLAASGFLGWWLQRLTPFALHSGDTLYQEEEIPRQIALVLEETDQLVSDSSTLGASPILKRYYQDRLRPWLTRPRDQWAHRFDSRAPRVRLAGQFSDVERYIDLEIREEFDALVALAFRKLELERQYSWHRLSHGWLLVHLPLTGITLTAIVIHILVVRSHTEGSF